jgi:hypothetical protein
MSHVITRDSGQVAYEAHCLSVRELGLSETTPAWDELSPDEQSCWRAAGVSAAEHYANQRAAMLRVHGYGDGLSSQAEAYELGRADERAKP